MLGTNIWQSIPRVYLNLMIYVGHNPSNHLSLCSIIPQKLVLLVRPCMQKVYYGSSSSQTKVATVLDLRKTSSHDVHNALSSSYDIKCDKDKS